MTVQSRLKQKKNVSTYPILVHAKDSGLVVLFTDPTTGTVVVADKHNRIGEYKEDWMDTNANIWRVLESGDIVELKND